MATKAKKGVELSLNTIIIAILAIVFLGIALAFIRNMGKQVEDLIPTIIPPGNALWPPTQDNPIFLVPKALDIDKNENKKISLEVYNYAAKDVNCDIKITPNDPATETNAAIKFLYAESNRPIDAGMVGHWDINVESGRASVPGTYLYTASANCGEFSKTVDLFVTVK